MRTTVTLEPGVARRVTELSRNENQSFNEALDTTFLIPEWRRSDLGKEAGYP